MATPRGPARPATTTVAAARMSFAAPWYTSRRRSVHPRDPVGIGSSRLAEISSLPPAIKPSPEARLALCISITSSLPTRRKPPHQRDQVVGSAQRDQPGCVVFQLIVILQAGERLARR